MSWKKPSDLIDKMLEKSKLSVKDDLLSCWSSMPDSRKAEVVTLDKGELILSVKNSAFLQEITFRKEQIKEELNRKIGNRISNIKLRLGG